MNRQTSPSSLSNLTGPSKLTSNTIPNGEDEGDLAIIVSTFSEVSGQYWS